MIILNQHGAHERILYEKLLANVRGTPANLPAPAVVQLPAGLAPEAWNFEVEIEALGFRVEPFGGDTVRLLAAPESVTDLKGAFIGALETLVGGEDLAKALACRGSTKFGETLTREEMPRCYGSGRRRSSRIRTPQLTERPAFGSAPCWGTKGRRCA